MRIPYAFPANTTRQQKIGIWRSHLTYNWMPLRRRRLRRMYGHFLQPGDLCFDVGAHLGNHVDIWLEMGACVVGVEPQPLCMHFLQRWYGNNPNVTLVDAAVGDRVGRQTLLISPRTPTVSTISTTWRDAVQATASFADLRWDETATVPVTTLDALIAQHGEPVFCKIDVEGCEPEVLHGLSQPLRALSFEYIPAAIESSIRCIDRLDELGDYEFNCSVGETYRFRETSWLSSAAMRTVLHGMERHARSGDVYARRRTPLGKN